MAVPKSKTSKSKSRSRRSANMKITLLNLSKCPSCGSSKRAHRVCLKCGFYKDKVVLDVEKFTHKYRYL